MGERYPKQLVHAHAGRTQMAVVGRPYAPVRRKAKL